MSVNLLEEYAERCIQLAYQCQNKNAEKFLRLLAVDLMLAAELRRPETRQPEVRQLDAHQPEVHQPETHQTEVSRLDAGQPEARQSELRRPNAIESELADLSRLSRAAIRGLGLAPGSASTA